MFKSKPGVVVEPVGQPVGPPPVEQVFNGAQASAAYARSIFEDAVAELVSANDALDEVVERTTESIAQLTALRDQADADRAANLGTIQRLQALIG